MKEERKVAAKKFALKNVKKVWNLYDEHDFFGWAKTKNEAYNRIMYISGGDLKSDVEINTADHIRIRSTTTGKIAEAKLEDLK